MTAPAAVAVSRTVWWLTGTELRNLGIRALRASDRPGVIDLALTAPGELDWQDDGLCREIGGDVFFPEQQDDDDAKRVCASCPVRAECLEYALETGQEFGIWGGLSETERTLRSTGTAPKAPGRCRGAGAHLKTPANTDANGRCRECRREEGRRSYAGPGLGKGRTLEPRKREANGRFATEPPGTKELAA